MLRTPRCCKDRCEVWGLGLIGAASMLGSPSGALTSQATLQCHPRICTRITDCLRAWFSWNRRQLQTKRLKVKHGQNIGAASLEQWPLCGMKSQSLNNKSVHSPANMNPHISCEPAATDLRIPPPQADTQKTYPCTYKSYNT